MNADIVMMIAILALGIGLVPQIIKNFKTKECGVVLGTTAITAVALWVMVGCFYSMKQWFSLFGCSTQATMWTIMLAQWYAYRPRPERCENCKHYLMFNELCRITKKCHEWKHVCKRFKERG